jgi:FAD/FMN-containing dehydrogenase
MAATVAIRLRAMGLDALKAAAGDGNWTDDPADIAPWLVDWRGRIRGASPLLLMPRTRDDVVRIVQAAGANGVPLVPQGGNTSLAGGSVPEADGRAAILSLRRMNAIRDIDVDDLALTAEAGAILEHVHAAAEAAGTMFPLSLGAKGSATVGGLVSTNAGGVQVLRYGTMRALVAGLEAVLPDGSVLDQMSGLRKDNSGFDVKQLLIGGEGTLGIVTAARLRLVPKPQAVATALVAVPSPQAALALLGRLRAATAGRVDSFELMPRLGLDLVLEHVAGTRDPFADAHPWYVLTEATSPNPGDRLDDLLVETLGAAAADGIVTDAVSATSGTQRAELWRLREELPEAERRGAPALKHDISVPVSRMPDFMTAVAAEIEAGWADATVLAFGHLGDGNVHFNVIRRGTALDAPESAAITAHVYARVAAFGGSISAEHGIGTLKREALARGGDPGKLAAMRLLKAALDPRGIMNPGKLL